MIEIREWQYIVADSLRNADMRRINEINKLAKEAGGSVVLARDQDYFYLEFSDKQDLLAFVLANDIVGHLERNPHYDTIVEYQKKHRRLK